MADKSLIEWTDATWNPIRGCSRVSDGCMNCYAEKVADRFSGPGQPYEGLIAKGGQWNSKIKFIDHVLDQPLRWRKPRKIFVNSMSDLFHENVTDEQIDQVFRVVARSPKHTFQVLTKRPERMLSYTKGWYKRNHYMTLPNLWLGVSVENQETADERIPILLQTRAAIRFLSCEPLLGSIDLTWIDRVDGMLVKKIEPVDWVIVGGESGPKSRPMHLDWAGSLRDQCNHAGIPFYFKQMGGRGRKTNWTPIPDDLMIKEYPELLEGE